MKGNNSFKNDATICKGLKNSLSKCRSCMDNFREGRTPHVSPRRGRYNYILRVEHYKFVDQYWIIWNKNKSKVLSVLCHRLPYRKWQIDCFIYNL
jgi:hypothetical protein